MFCQAVQCVVQNYIWPCLLPVDLVWPRSAQSVPCNQKPWDVLDRMWFDFAFCSVGPVSLRDEFPVIITEHFYWRIQSLVGSFLTILCLWFAPIKCLNILFHWQINFHIGLSTLFSCALYLFTHGKDKRGKISLWLTKHYVVKLYGEMASALARNEWRASRSCRFTTRERATDTQYWKFLTLLGLILRRLGCPAHSQKRYRLRYSGPRFHRTMEIFRSPCEPIS
jgi:hypothetical protein